MIYKYKHKRDRGYALALVVITAAVGASVFAVSSVMIDRDDENGDVTVATTTIANTTTSTTTMATTTATATIATTVPVAPITPVAPAVSEPYAPSGIIVPQFRYALQAGDMGIELGAGTRVRGDIYSASFIRAESDVTVIGEATASGSSSSGGGIFGPSEWDRLSVSSARAQHVAGVAATGSIYCQAGIFNNKACNTSLSSFPQASQPLSVSDISLWKSRAESGGVSSSVNVGHAGSVIGPIKIDGNLVIEDGGRFELSGMVWVTGNVVIHDGATVIPASPGQSFAIISDGNISVSGGARISGRETGHIGLVTTSSSARAVIIDGGSNNTYVIAPNGIVTVTGGTDIQAITAHGIRLNGGAQVIYDR